MDHHLKDFVIQNPSLIRGQIYNRIKQEILSGNISPGSRVLEGRLAKQVNVSRTPVREALHALEMEGILESFPRVGYRVRQITWEEAIEINEMRAVLEPLAARKAIESEDQSYIAVLEEVLIQSEEVAKQDKTDSFLKYDTEFDEIIVRASGIKTLLDIWATLRHRLRLYRIGDQNSPDAIKRSVKGHWRILECLKTRDQEGVKKAISEHLEDSKQDIKRIMFRSASG
ncbi:MAG TPA: GntR family transcriptional regulator [Thermodesulfobacteriota bacterium]|nr:GntR family transcriptional regulator [Thermodesulfobacteriota bacterium]